MAAAAALAATSLVFGSATPASATTVVERSTKTVKVSSTKTYYSKDIKRCLRVTISGTMKVIYVRSKDYRGGDYQSLTNPTIHAPKMVLRTTKSCSSTKAAKISKAKLTQSFSYYQCGGTLAYSVSYPLTVGIAFTPSCGNRKAIQRTTGYSKNASSFTQSNSNSKGVVKRVSYGPTSTKVTSCVAMGAVVTAWQPANKSDSVKLNLGKACVSV